MGIGVMCMPLLVQAFLKPGGWSSAYEMLGGVVLLVSLPSSLLVTEARSAMPLEQRQTDAKADGDARPADALRQFRFWALAAGFFFWAAAINSTALQLVPLIQSTGIDRATALTAASVFGAAMLVGRIGTGLLIDRYFAPYVAAALMTASTIAIGMLARGVPGGLVLVAAFLVGISAGSDGDILSYLIARYFGLRSFATLSSLVFAIYLVGTSTFPWLTGLLAGRYGGYGIPMLICAGLGAACVASMLLFGISCNRPLGRVSAAGSRCP
jgi:MFS family permease